jgi:hypothetical protein
MNVTDAWSGGFASMKTVDIQVIERIISCSTSSESTNFQRYYQISMQILTSTNKLLAQAKDEGSNKKISTYRTRMDNVRTVPSRNPSYTARRAL